ncbi:MAG TPA: alpha/beta fold hydrolase [Polyangia bacterium]|nr:alpha/beta fold hydrolase [Polyangia bacterium]
MSDSGQPCWFGGAEAPLFGWYHPAAATETVAARDLAVVICPPFGYEAVCAHRGLRALAETLCGAGLPVLRFDYHGTGDSSGDDRQPERVKAWLASVAAAIDEAKKKSGRSAVALIGLRLGALLAGTAAAARNDVRALVLWATCPSGKAFLREMKMLRLTGDGELPTARTAEALGRAPDDEEAAGFLLSVSTMEALKALSLLSLDRRPAQAAYLLQRDDLPDDSRLTKRLRDLGVETREEKLPGYLALMQDPHRSLRPASALAAIATWLVEHSQPAAAGVAPEPAPAGAESSVAALIPVVDHQGQGGAAVREEAITFVAGGLRLSGVLCEPQPGHPVGGNGVPARRRAVVMLNAGAIRRIGPNRLYVQMARAWARRGLTSLRVDLSGLGDSAGEDPVGSRLYSMISVPEAQAAVRFLRESRAFETVTVLGLCSGAFVAFHAALVDGTIDSTVLINPQLFFWKEGTSLDVARRTSYQASQHYRQSVFRRESWAKLLRGDVDVPRVARLLGARVADVARDQLSPLLELVRAPQDEVLTAFRASIARRVNTHLVFCSGDPGLDNIQAHLGRGLRRLGSAGQLQGKVKMDVIEGPDHTFTPLWSHPQLMDLLTNQLLGH